MGRLFWKFFAFVWLAQLGAIIAVGSLFWLRDRSSDVVSSEFAAGPLAASQVHAGAEILRYAGTGAFGGWSSHEREAVVFAVDDAGHDVLGRRVPPGVTSAVGQLEKDHPQSPEIARVTAIDGRSYTIFAVRAAAPGQEAPPPPPRPRSYYWPRTLPPPNAMIATLTASVLTAFLLAWYVAKPIRSLRGAFEAAASGDLERRISAQIGSRNDELADLGRDFDRMAARLQASMEGQKRLLHDVSHELRSPLARLQAVAGLMRQKTEEPAAMVARIEEETARIDRLVGELLTLSRLEAGELAGVEEDVDMHDLVQEIVDDANFEAEAQGRQVVWEESGSATVRGRPDLLHSAIENIVRNALKHAAASRVVVIETAPDVAQEQYILRVLDEGHGIPEDELPRLFTPFYRGANSASTDGYGLGLAIARRCVEAHGGTIRAGNRPGGGLRVEIVLPWRRGQGEIRPDPSQEHQRGLPPS